MLENRKKKIDKCLLEINKKRTWLAEQLGVTEQAVSQQFTKKGDLSEKTYNQYKEVLLKEPPRNPRGLATRLNW